MMNIFYNHALTLHLLPCRQHPPVAYACVAQEKRDKQKISAYLFDK